MMLLFESCRRYTGRPGGYPARALGVRALRVRWAVVAGYRTNIEAGLCPTATAGTERHLRWRSALVEGERSHGSEDTGSVTDAQNRVGSVSDQHDAAADGAVATECANVCDDPCSCRSVRLRADW
jgi:hypothetical protein